MCDIKLARGTPSRSPRVVDFIKTAIPQLCELKDVDFLESESVIEAKLAKLAVREEEDKMEEDKIEGKMEGAEMVCDDVSSDIEMVSLETSVANHSLEENDKRKTAIKLSKTGE